MSEWYKVGGQFTLRHGDRERVYRVRTAAVSFVRHPGGTALAVTAQTDPRDSESDDFPIGASLAIVLNGADETRSGTVRRELEPRSTEGMPPPMLYLDDMHRIMRLSVEVSEALDKRLVRLEGSAGGFDFRMTVCARFGGVTQLDTTLPPGGQWWDGHYENAVVWPNDAPLTSAIWKDTAEFRRLVRSCFPRPIRIAEPPVGRMKAFARRLGLLPPPLPPPPPPFVPPCSDRQAQFLLAAFIEHFLADMRPNGSPDEFRDIARTIERFADGTATDSDLRAAAPVIGRTCLTNYEVFFSDYSPGSARNWMRYAHLDFSMPPDSIITGLFPERSRHGCDVVRDVLGDPFHPVRFDTSWLTSTAVSIARGVHQDRGFDRIPVLADALEEAGCANEAVLAHCRGDHLHVRGCWVLDGLLRSSTRG